MSLSQTLLEVSHDSTRLLTQRVQLYGGYTHKEFRAALQGILHDHHKQITAIIHTDAGLRQVKDTLFDASQDDDATLRRSCALNAAEDNVDAEISLIVAGDQARLRLLRRGGTLPIGIHAKMLYVLILMARGLTFGSFLKGITALRKPVLMLIAISGLAVFHRYSLNCHFLFLIALMRRVRPDRMVV